MGFIRPFLEVIEPPLPNASDMLALLQDKTDDDRVPIQWAYDLLNAATCWSQDPDIGLKAGVRLSFGDAGVLDYVASSSSNVSEALDAVMRYVPLINDALACRLQLDHEQVCLRFEHADSPVPPAAEDFTLCAFFRCNPWFQTIPGLECRLMQNAPNQPRCYWETFGGIRCEFSAPFSGYVFGRQHLSRPLMTADRKLHRIASEVADLRLARCLPTQLSAPEVKALLRRTILTPGVGAAYVARQLKTSVRTLTRRLAAEGTSFTALLDDVRREYALELVLTDRTISEITETCGFSHIASFHRSFRRWTGVTPAQYRAARRGPAHWQGRRA